MTRLLKQGRVLAALAAAALVLFLIGCNGEQDAVESAVKDAARALASAPAGVEPLRPGIVPDPEEGGELMYEEMPSPGLSDYIDRIDYSVSQAMQRSGLNLNGLRVKTDGFVEHKGYIYHAKTLEIYGIKEIPLFAQALRDSLLAWAEHATLLRDEADSSGSSWKILLDDAVTHYIYLFYGSGEPDEKRPRLVIVMDDLGESKRQAKRLLALDYPVTFAIWPHSTHGKAVAKMGHEGGAEVIIHQPMEPEGYPKVKPGKGVLLSGMSQEEIQAILDENLALVPYASGLNNHMGSRLTQNEETMRFVSDYLHQRGFLVLDSLTHAKSRFSKAAAQSGATTLKRDIFLDVEADKNKVLAQLRKAEQVALVKGQAIAIGHPLSATLDALEEWEKTRDKQIAVVRLKDLTPIAPLSNFPKQ